MDAFISLKLLCCVVLLTKASTASSCPSAKCSSLSPEIRFPFRIQGLQPHQCGLPEFSLFCKQNRTMIHFPAYGDLVVKSISYDTRRLSLLDPKNCVHEVFLNLNHSLTPFSYYYALQQYRYINCSSEIVTSYKQVPCLSGSSHHVYVVEPSFSLPVSCSSVKTVAIPFAYSPYLYDSSFGLGLTWNPRRINGEEEENSGCEPGNLCETGKQQRYFKALCAATGAIASVFIVGKLLYAYLSKYREELIEEKVMETLGEEETEKLLAEYEALDAAGL